MGRRRPRLRARRGPARRAPVRKDLASAVAAIVGSLPGFTLPFVAALVLSPSASDLLLLAVSIAVTQSVIVSSAAEMTTVAEYGRMLGPSRGTDRRRAAGVPLARRCASPSC